MGIIDLVLKSELFSNDSDDIFYFKYFAKNKVLIESFCSRYLCLSVCLTHAIYVQIVDTIVTK